MRFIIDKINAISKNIQPKTITILLRMIPLIIRLNERMNLTKLNFSKIVVKNLVKIKLEIMARKFVGRIRYSIL